jgi:2-polyprenyl-3-methyl-5-hydroxy-6-metoxy-1,4-benzoquinol methylase
MLKSYTMNKLHTRCRVCSSTNLIKYLDLERMPLPNNLELTEQLAIDKERFPLEVMFCKHCGLSQLSVVIDPDELFKYYTYRSGINKGYINHCHKMAEDLQVRFGFNSETKHVDIAGNDGTLLKEFIKILHNDDKICNVDPAENLREICEVNRIFTISKFWTVELAESTFKDRVDLLTATNVFAHLDDVRGFIQACKIAMKPEAILVIENPYLIDFIENMEFDTIYFEHVSYWSLLPMIRLCSENGMKVISAEKQAIHGGSMRYIIAHENSKYIPSSAIKNLCNEEIRRGFNKDVVYLEWSEKVHSYISTFRGNLLELKRQNKTIISFAASAKGNTLLNCSNIGNDIIECIIDETPEKIGKYYPGVGIPIIGIENIMKISPDYIVILSWNFKEEIIEKIRALGYDKNFIIPIPRWEVI